MKKWKGHIMCHAHWPGKHVRRRITSLLLVLCMVGACLAPAAQAVEAGDPYTISKDSTVDSIKAIFADDDMTVDIVNDPEVQIKIGLSKAIYDLNDVVTIDGVDVSICFKAGVTYNYIIIEGAEGKDTFNVVNAGKLRLGSNDDQGKLKVCGGAGTETVGAGNAITAAEGTEVHLVKLEIHMGEQHSNYKGDPNIGIDASAGAKVYVTNGNGKILYNNGNNYGIVLLSLPDTLFNADTGSAETDKDMAKIMDNHTRWVILPDDSMDLTICLVKLDSTSLLTEIYASGKSIEFDAYGTDTNYTTIKVEGKSVPRIGEISCSHEDTCAEDHYYLGSAHIYGGCLFNDLTTDTHVTVTGGKVGYIYGGGYNRRVNGTTNVLITGGTVSGIYGGGHTENIYWGGDSSDVTEASVIIEGGKVTDRVYGGGSSSDVSEATIVVKDGTIADVYGGSYSGLRDDINTTISVSGGKISNLIAGGRKSSSGNVEINLSKDANVTNLYGGADDTTKVVKSATIDMSGKGTVGTMVLSGGKIADNGVMNAVDSTLEMTGGKITKLCGGSDGANITIHKPSVSLLGGTVSILSDFSLGADLTVGGEVSIGDSYNYGIPIIQDAGDSTKGISKFTIKDELTGKVFIKLADDYDVSSEPVVVTNASEASAEHVFLHSTSPEGNALLFKSEDSTIRATTKKCKVDIKTTLDGETVTDYTYSLKDAVSGTTVTNMNYVENGEYKLYIKENGGEETDTGETVTVSGNDVSLTREYFSATFYNGDETLETYRVLKGGKVSRPADNPQKAGYTFDNWYDSETGGTPFNFEGAITKKTDIYAGWTATQITLNESSYNADAVYLTEITKDKPLYDLKSIVITNDAEGEAVKYELKSGSLPEGLTFEDGKIYGTPTSTENIGEDIQCIFTITGNNGTTADFELTIHISKLSLTEIDVQLTAPDGGKAPEVTLPEGEGWKAVSITWTPSVVDVFDYGETYKAEIEIEPEAGYAFSADMSATVNTENVEDVTVKDTGAACTVIYTFPTTATRTEKPEFKSNEYKMLGDRKEAEFIINGDGADKKYALYKDETDSQPVTEPSLSVVDGKLVLKFTERPEGESVTYWVSAAADNEKESERIELKIILKGDMYTVTFCDGDDETPRSVEEGSKVEMPTDPAKRGYSFNGWMTEDGGSEEFDFNSPITSDINLYASWTATQIELPNEGEDRTDAIYLTETTKDKPLYDLTSIGIINDADVGTAKYELKSGSLPEGLTFEDGKIYGKPTNAADVREDGIQCTFTITGNNGTAADFELTIHISKLSLTEIDVQLTAPDSGNAPDVTLPEGEGWKAVSITWTPSVADVFDYGVTYKAEIEIEPEAGYAFSADMSATVNTENVADVTVKDSGVACTVTYTFPTTATRTEKPEFKSNEYKMLGDRKEAEFIINGDGADKIYALYKDETDSQPVTEPSLSVVDGKLVLKFTERPDRESVTYWVSAAADGEKESKRTVITVILKGDMYTVTFCDGDDETSRSVEEGSKVEMPTQPVKKGYSFNGWMTEDGGSEEFDFDSPITSDISLYASWTATQIALSQYIGEAKAEFNRDYTVNDPVYDLTSITVENDAEGDAPSYAAREGTMPEGLYIDDGKICGRLSIDSDREMEITITVTGANKTQTDFVLKLTMNDILLSKVEVTGIDRPMANEKPKTQADAEFVNIDVVSWEPEVESTFVSGETYTVKMQIRAENKYGFAENVEVNIDGVKAQEVVISDDNKTASVRCTFGETEERPRTDAPEFADTSAVLEGVDGEIFAEFALSNYAEGVNYRLYAAEAGGEALANEIQLEKQPSGLVQFRIMYGSEPEFELYEEYFAAAAKDGERESLRTKVTVIQRETYTVTFYDGDKPYGAGPQSVQYVKKGGKATEPAAPVREGYEFGGWYGDRECTQAYSFDSQVTANLSLYAKWTDSGYKFGNTTIEPPADKTITIDPGTGMIEVPDGSKVTVDGNGEEAVIYPTKDVTVDMISGAVTVPEGNDITIRDTVIGVPEGEKVTVNPDGSISVSAGGSITAGDTTVTLPSGGGIKVNPDGSIDVPKGGTVTDKDGNVTKLPEGGKVNADGSVTDNDSRPVDIKGSIVQPEHGLITADKDTAMPGETVVIKVVPDSGYILKIDSLRVTEVSTGESVSIMPVLDKLGEYSFQVPKGQIIIEAQLEKLQQSSSYDVVVSAGAGGSVRADKEWAKPGETVTVRVKAEDGCEAGQVTATSPVGGVELTKGKMPGRYTFTMPEGWVSVTALFNKIKAEVTDVIIWPMIVTVRQGELQQFNAEVFGTNEPSDRVVWTAEGKTTSGTAVRGIEITASGRLSVPEDVPDGTVIVVTAASVEDPKKTAEAVAVVVSHQNIVPELSKLPDTQTYEEGLKAEELKVEVRGAELSEVMYQWYMSMLNPAKVTSGAAIGGTPIAGANGPSHRPETEKAGIYYYYVAVETAQASMLASAADMAPRADRSIITSNVAKIIVKSPGGRVTNMDELIDALGGSEYVERTGDSNVQMKKDIELSNTLTVGGGLHATIDLNGNELKAGTKDDGEGMDTIVVEDGSSVTITDSQGSGAVVGGSGANGGNGGDAIVVKGGGSVVADGVHIAGGKGGDSDGGQGGSGGSGITVEPDGSADIDGTVTGGSGGNGQSGGNGGAGIVTDGGKVDAGGSNVTGGDGGSGQSGPGGSGGPGIDTDGTVSTGTDGDVCIGGGAISGGDGGSSETGRGGSGGTGVEAGGGLTGGQVAEIAGGDGGSGEIGGNGGPGVTGSGDMTVDSGSTVTGGAGGSGQTGGNGGSGITTDGSITIADSDVAGGAGGNGTESGGNGGTGAETERGSIAAGQGGTLSGGNGGSGQESGGSGGSGAETASGDITVEGAITGGDGGKGQNGGKGGDGLTTGNGSVEIKDGGQSTGGDGGQAGEGSGGSGGQGVEAGPGSNVVIEGGGQSAGGSGGNSATGTGGAGGDGVHSDKGTVSGQENAAGGQGGTGPAGNGNTGSDTKVEKGSGGGSSSSGSSTSKADKPSGEPAVYEPKITAKDNEAEITVSQTEGSRLAEEAAKNESSQIIIRPQITGEANKVTITLPESIVDKIAKDTDAALTAETPTGNVTISEETVKELRGKGDLSIIIVKESPSTGSIAIKAGGSDVVLKGHATVKLSYDSKGGTVEVYVTKTDGSREKADAVYDEEKGTVSFNIDRSLSYEITETDTSVGGFTDISGHWAEEYITAAVERGWFKGTSKTEFSPDDTITRGMMITVIYRMSGEKATGSADYDDVSSQAYYAEAVAWGTENGVVQGFGDGTFRPEDKINREQLAIMLCGYAEHIRLDMSGRAALNFTDAQSISYWAEDSVAWCVNNGILQGKEDGRFDPKAGATRAQAATVLLNMQRALRTI